MLQRAYSEKNSEVEKTEKLQSNITELHQQLAEQAKHHQRLLNDERVLQENSEKRWIKLIDQARTETNEQRKHFENIVSRKDTQVEKLQSALSALQQTQFAQQGALEQKDQQILMVSEQYQKLQIRYEEITTSHTVLQERLTFLRKQTERVVTKKQSKNARAA